jgi:hypothetical protein
MAEMPSALTIKPKISMSSLSDDMRGSPSKKHESLRGMMYLRADFAGPSRVNAGRLLP